MARDESGLTLVELLVASAMSVLIVAGATSMLISAVRQQPELSEKAQAISTARYVLERMTREIRNGIVVYDGTGSKVEFKTQVRREACGGGVEEDPDVPAIECRVTYSCTTTSCSRTETAPAVEGALGTPTTLVSGLVSSKVFNYEQESSEEDETTTYVGIALHIANPDGEGELTVTDGASLRIQNYLVS